MSLRTPAIRVPSGGAAAALVLGCYLLGNTVVVAHGVRPPGWNPRPQVGEPAARALLRAPNAAVAVERIRFDRRVLIPSNGSKDRHHKPKAMGDFTGDGRVDVVAYTGGKGLGLYIGPSWDYRLISPGGQGEQAQAADVDADGDLDVVVGGIGKSARWFENPLPRTQPTAAIWREHGIGGSASHDLEVGQIDGAGRIDVATGEGIWLQDAAGKWRLLSNARTFPRRRAVSTGTGTKLLDVLHDGKPDLVDIVDGSIVWYENPRSTGKPVTAPWPKHVIGRSLGSQCSIAGFRSTATAALQISMATEYPGGNDGFIVFTAPADPRTPGWPLFADIDPTVEGVHSGGTMVGDVDGNGRPDLVIAEQEQSHDVRSQIRYDNDKVAIYFNDTDGWKRQILALTGGHNLKIGDLDRDGDLDILNANHGFFGAPNALELWTNRRVP